MNPADLLAHLRRRSAGTRPDDHVAAPTHTAPPGRCAETNPTAPKPQEGSPPRDELTPDQRAAIDAATTRQPIDRTPTTSDMLTDLQTAVAMFAQAHDVPEPIGQVWPSPRTWIDAELTEREAFREKRVLAELADPPPPEGPPVTGHVLHRPTAGGHLLVTVDVGEFWRKMPAQAVRARIADRLAWYATALTAAGYGVATWGRGDRPEALIVAVDQAAVERQARDVRAYLTAHNVRKDTHA